MYGTWLALFMVAGACSKKTAPELPAPDRAPVERATPVTDDDASARARAEAEARARAEAERRRSILAERVFFGYDSADLDEQALAVLARKVELLRADTPIRLQIEGHADERGSIEYNLALGMRRAQSIMSYLVGFGVDAGRFRVESFGEDRPLTQGTTESAWAQNRRGEFVILGGVSAAR
jgi:peptidoglycan-associated lipoprotein